jgi:hypothetical protein
MPKNLMTIILWLVVGIAIERFFAISRKVIPG